jgi:hypothetical protein
VPSQTDPDNCGTCGHVCATGDICVKGVCTPTCNGGPACDADAGMACCAGGCVDVMSGDANNCGACGHGCCGGACQAGVCQAFPLTQANSPAALAIDQNNVYWPEDVPDGGIYYTPLGGGPPTPLTPGQASPYAVAVDSNFVYWVTSDNSNPTAGGVFKVPIDGGSVITLVDGGENLPNDVKIDSTAIFWDDHGSDLIRRAALDGTNVDTVADASVGVSAPQQMAIDGQNIYWPDRFNGSIQKAPLNGSGATNIATGSDPVSLVVDTQFVYWANYSGAIQKAPLSGKGPTTTIATSGGSGPWSIQVDGKYVYWADQGKPAGAGTDGGPNGSIRAASINGTGAQGMVLAESPNPKFLVINNTCIYWSDTSGTIQVVAKPP